MKKKILTANINVAFLVDDQTDVDDVDIMTKLIGEKISDCFDWEYNEDYIMTQEFDENKTYEKGEIFEI